MRCLWGFSQMVPDALRLGHATMIEMTREVRIGKWHRECTVRWMWLSDGRRYRLSGLEHESPSPLMVPRVPACFMCLRLLVVQILDRPRRGCSGALMLVARALCQPVLGISMREARSSVLCVTVSARCVGRDRKRERDRVRAFAFYDARTRALAIDYVRWFYRA